MNQSVEFSNRSERKEIRRHPDNKYLLDTSKFSMIAMDHIIDNIMSNLNYKLQVGC